MLHWTHHLCIVVCSLASVCKESGIHLLTYNSPASGYRWRYFLFSLHCVCATVSASSTRSCWSSSGCWWKTTILNRLSSSRQEHAFFFLLPCVLYSRRQELGRLEAVDNRRKTCPIVCQQCPHTESNEVKRRRWRRRRYLHSVCLAFLWIVIKIADKFYFSALQFIFLLNVA